MEILLQDLRFGIRMLRKSPGFSAVVILTLALGIGANTALFSVVDAILLRPLPYSQPEQLVSVKEDMPGANLTDAGTTAARNSSDFLKKALWRVRAIARRVWPINANITGREKPQRVEANAVSTSYFTLLRARPAIGRVWNDADSREGFSEGAVISESLWHTMFGADPNVLGQAIRIDTDLYTIIGLSCRPAFAIPDVLSGTT